MGKNIEAATVQIIRTRSEYHVYERTGKLISIHSCDQILVPRDNLTSPARTAFN